MRPTKAKVLGWPWAITWTRQDPLLGSNNGVCIYPFRHIMIQVDQSDPRTTLLHELMHACWWETHLPEEGSMDLGGLLGEEVVNRLAPALYRTLVDSPGLANYLLEKP